MAVLKWGDVKPEDFTGAPKMLDVKTFCYWVMYFSEAMQEVWERDPSARREDVAAAMSGIRFKMHGWRLQLNQEGEDYVLYRAKGRVARPPRFEAMSPRNDKPSSDDCRADGEEPKIGSPEDVPEVALLEEDNPNDASEAALLIEDVALGEDVAPEIEEAIKDSPAEETIADAPAEERRAVADVDAAEAGVEPDASSQEGDTSDEREIAPDCSVQLCAAFDLPKRIEATRHDAAVILSRLRASVARAREQNDAMWAHIADKLSQYRTHAVSFVQHEMRGRKILQLLSGFRKSAFDLGTAGARLQPILIECGGLTVALRTWRDLAPKIDWDSYLFGELPPEESELATG